jgi:hypothetical protein
MIDLITVVFRDELPLLQIQARSIERYVSGINTITVVVNDSADVAELIDTAWWGKYQHCVQVTIRNFESRVTGWESQQLCKLLSASCCNSDWSMVLDAKTWFVKLLDTADLFDQQGRPCSGLSGISPHFEPSRQFVERYYDICMPQVIGPGGVPFVFHTKTVQSMIDNIENFVDFFQTHLRYPDLVTEFHLYSGHVIKQHGSLDCLYNTRSVLRVVNIDHSQLTEFDNLLTSMQSSTVLTASVHRRLYSQMTAQQLLAWKDFLIVKELLQSSDLIQNKLNTVIN